MLSIIIFYKDIVMILS